MTKPEFVPVFERLGVSSLLVVRLRARATNLGFIALVRNGAERTPYTDDDLHLVQDLADRAALAIDNGRLLADLEHRVLERTKDLETINRELEAFSYSVSHDLRAPLRAIDGFSQMLEEDHGGALDDDGRRVVGVIRKNTQRMGRLIDDLLRFSRLGRQAMDPVEVQMRTLVNVVANEIIASEPARALEFRIGDLPPAVCDYDLIRQVWANLLGHAAKYTRGRPAAVIEVQGVVEGNEVRYTVADNGCGFDPKYSGKLFEVFQRLHTAAEFEGTGVGLALVQRIVSKHGGRVWADGRPSEGATFGFALPRRSVHA
jgi:two-component system sensor kinase